MKFPYKLNHELPGIQVLGRLFRDEPRSLDFRGTYYLQPAILPMIALYLSEQKGVSVSASPPIRQLFQSYGLLKSREPYPNRIFPLRFFKRSEDVACQLEAFVPKSWIAAYLRGFLDLLAPGFCLGHSNLGGGWLFFSIATKKVPHLDNFRWHLLESEFQLAGGKLWAWQQDRFYTMKEVAQLDTWTEKTLIIIAFSLTDVG